MNRWLIAASLGMLCWASSASAQTDVSSGNYWYQQCSSTDAGARNSCVSYLFGLDAGISMETAIAQARPVFCAPKGVTNGQKVDIFTKYLAAHPENRQEPAVLHYVMAMTQAYPCKK
jgi:hypothetical protein